MLAAELVVVFIVSSKLLLPFVARPKEVVNVVCSTCGTEFAARFIDATEASTGAVVHAIVA
jgi:hypothetical protein